MNTKKELNNYFLKSLKYKFLKNELKRYILRSIIQNQKVKPIIRARAIYKLTRLKLNSSIAKQYSVCFETGKIKSNITKYNRSRQITKAYGWKNNLPSTKIKSW